MAHLSFYKKYYPKAGDVTADLDSPEKFMAILSEQWADHRRKLTADAQPTA